MRRDRTSNMSDQFDLVVSFDLKVPGATAFFSWPSRGRLPAPLATSDEQQAAC
jgi:hypothetical protein